MMRLGGGAHSSLFDRSIDHLEQPYCSKGSLEGVYKLADLAVVLVDYWRKIMPI